MMDFTSMMAPKKMIKQMTEFNKTAYENSFKGIALFQEQAEKMTKTMIDQATWLPDESKNALESWATAYKSAYDNFKTMMDESFKKAEEYLSD
jgi:hypothetical protein